MNQLDLPEVILTTSCSHFICAKCAAEQIRIWKFLGAIERGVPYAEHA